jgi:hypothetical protein
VIPSSFPAVLHHVAARLQRVAGAGPDTELLIDLDHDDCRELGNAVALLRLVMGRLIAPEPRRRPSARWRFYWPVVQSMPREHWRRRRAARDAEANNHA